MGDYPKIRSRSVAIGSPPVHLTPAPLLWPVAGLVLGIAASESLDLARLGIIPLAVPAIIIAAVAVAPRRIFAILLMVSALFVGAARHQASVHLDDSHISRYLEDKPILTRVTGHIVSTPAVRPATRLNPFLPFEPKPRVQFLIEATELATNDPPTPVSGFVRVSVEAAKLPVHLGDQVTIAGWMYRPQRARNPGGIDWAATQRLEGVYAGLKSPGPQYITTVGGSTPSLWHAARDRIRAFSRSLLFEPYANAEADDARGLLDAIVLGQRSAVGRELNEAFVRTGAMHFLAVSGFHVGVLALSAWWFTRRALRRSEFGAGMTTILVMAVYLLLVEHNAPVLRATIMGIFACAARMRGRPLNVFNWLALSAACLLIYNPLQLYRPGFQLSFLLIVALVTVVPRVHARLTRRRPELGPPAEPDNLWRLIALKLRNYAVGLAVVNLCAWTLSLPLVAFHFGRFAPYGAIQSFLLTPIVFGVVVFGFLSIVVAPLLGPFGFLLDGPLRFFTDSLLWSVDRLSQLPGAVLQASPRPAAIVLAIYILIALVFVVYRRRAESNRAPATLRIGSAIALAIVSAVWILYPHRFGERRAFELHVFAVGNGSAAVLTTPQRHALVFDAGTLSNWDVGKSVARALKSLRIRAVDLVCISHANFDHYSGVSSLLESYSADSLIVSSYFPRERVRHPSVILWYELLPRHAPDIANTMAGDDLELSPSLRDDGVSIEVLWPPDGLNDWKPNDRSLVLRLTIAGSTILLPGDIERAAMNALLESVADGRLSLSADVLIAPHHGSIVGRTTEAFYAAARPHTVIVSSGRDRSKLVALIRETLGSSCRVFNTRDVGAVVVRVDSDGKLAVDTPYDRRPDLP